MFAMSLPGNQADIPVTAVVDRSEILSDLTADALEAVPGLLQDE
jgi:hypothetical protein